MRLKRWPRCSGDGLTPSRFPVPVVGAKSTPFLSVAALGCCFPGGNPCPRELEEIQLLDTASVVPVVFYGVGRGWRGELGCAPGLSPVLQPRESPSAHTAGHGVRCSSPRSCHVLGNYGFTSPAQIWLRGDISPWCHHLPPAPSDSQGKRQEVTTRDRQTDRHLQEGD